MDKRCFVCGMRRAVRLPRISVEIETDLILISNSVTIKPSSLPIQNRIGFLKMWQFL